MNMFCSNWYEMKKNEDDSRYSIYMPLIETQAGSLHAHRLASTHVFVLIDILSTT